MKAKLIFIAMICCTQFAWSQSWDWVSTIQGTASDYAWDLVIDSEDNLIITGRVKGDATYGNGITSQFFATLGSETDIFLAKFNDQGDLLWGKRFGDVDPDWGRALAVDNEDNIYLTGDFCNNATFDGNTISGYNNGATLPNSMARSGFLVKYDKNGNQVYLNKFQGGDRCRGYGIAVDSSQNVYLTGTISGLTDFGNGVVTGEASVAVFGFLAKYNSNGQCIWANYFDSPYGTQGNDIQMVGEDKIVCTGFYRSQLLYDGQTISGASATWGDFFMMQLDSAGNFIWNVKGTGPYLIQGFNMVVDSDYNIFVIGHFSSTMNLGDTTLTYLGTGTTTAEINARPDSYVAKYDSTGNRIWIRQFGSQYRTEVSGIALRQNGHVMISGYSEDTIIFNGGLDSIQLVGTYHTGFVIELNSSGNYVWHKLVTPAGNPTAASYNAIIGNTAFCIDVDSYDNIYSAGLFGDEAYWDTTHQNAYSTGHDAFIGKIYPPLEPQINYSGLCLNDTLEFGASYFGNPVTGVWTVQNNLIISQNADSLIVDGSISAHDSVSYIVSNGYESDTLYIIFDLLSAPEPNLGQDISACEINLVLNAGAGGLWYDWGSGPTAYDSLLAISSPGIYSVIVSDLNGCSGFDTVIVSQLDCSGIQEFYTTRTLSYYPNPVLSDQLLTVKFTDSSPVDVAIFDAYGRLVFKENFESDLIYLPTAHLASGFYTVRVNYTDLGELEVFNFQLVDNH